MWNKSKTAGLALFMLPAVYYYINSYPGLGLIDSGELALCSLNLGIAHPTGYPLYTLISRIFTLFGTRPVVATGFFAAVSTAGAVFVFYSILITLKSSIAAQFDRHNITPVIASLILSVAPVIVEQGVINEVYGIGLLLNLLAVYAALRLLTSDRRSEAGRYLLLTWFLTGLSLGNHLNSIQLLPGLLILSVIYLRRYRGFSTLLVAPIFFLIPLTLYLSLPMRSAIIPPPLADWGDVTSLDSFLRHISGWQFRIWFLTSDAATVWGNFNNFLAIIKAQYPWPLLILIPIGWWHLSLRLPGMLYLILSALLINIGFGINYSIPDISGYYLLSIALILVLIVCGVYTITRMKSSRSAIVRFVLPLIGLIFLSWQIYLTTPQNYKGDYYLAEDFALNLGRSAGYKGTIITEIWDHHGQLFYLQQAECFRPDLKLIDKELLRRSWYYKNLKSTYPKLYATIEDLVDPFLKEIKVFESGGDFNATRLEYSYQAIINRIILANQPAYIDYHLTYTPRGNQYLVPQGLLYRVETIRPESLPLKPELIWRGKSLESYLMPQEINHVRNITEMLGK